VLEGQYFVTERVASPSNCAKNVKTRFRRVGGGCRGPAMVDGRCRRRWRRGAV